LPVATATFIAAVAKGVGNNARETAGRAWTRRRQTAHVNAREIIGSGRRPGAGAVRAAAQAGWSVTTAAGVAAASERAVFRVAVAAVEEAWVEVVLAEAVADARGSG